MRQLEIRVLGPVRIAVAEGAMAISSVRARTVLAALALRHDAVVSVDELIDVAWGASAPRTAANQLQIAVFRLRQAVATAGADPQAALVTHPTGYQLVSSVVRLDLAEFRRLSGEAEQAARSGDWAGAAELYTRALSLWHGDACQDVQAARITEAAGLLEQERRDAAERLITVELLLDRPVATAAARLLERDPLRERPWHLLILGHARTGRQATALEEYQRARRTFVNELGLEPGAHLQRLEQDVLRGDLDAALDRVRAWFPTPPPALASPSPKPAAVWQVPADIPDFTGRGAEVEQISTLLAVDGEHPAVVCVAGLGGMGKTTLAVRVARRLRDRFPDGCIFFDLRGTDPRPPGPHRITGSILRSLGLPGPAVPDEPAARTGLLRSELAGRRLLLVMDNAADEQQVRPLVPPDGGSALLVTGRRMLAGLDGAHLVDLDVLPVEDGVRLLSALAGAERVDTDPAGAQRLVDLCGRLPLAVRIAGVRLSRRASLTVNRMAERLADEQSRLDELTFGDREVRAVFAVSHGRLDPQAAALLRRLGQLPTPEAPGWLAAALLDLPLRPAERVAQQLIDASLLTERETAADSRYRLHDLVHLYAREQADDGDDVDALHRAYETLADHALRADLGLPTQPFPQPGWPGRGHVRADSVRWFEAEEALLLGAARDAAARGWVGLARRLVTTMANYVTLQPHIEEWHAAARLLATMEPDGPERDGVRLALGMEDQNRGRIDDALPLLRQARLSFLRHGDAERAATTAVFLGVASRRVGRWRVTAAANDWAIRRLDPDRFAPQLARALLSKGNLALDRDGDMTEARVSFERSLALMRSGGDVDGEGNVLAVLALSLRREGRLEEARKFSEEAVRAHKAAGSHNALSIVTAYLSRILLDLGDAAGASRAAAKSLDAAIESRHTRALREAHSVSGSAALAVGDVPAAVDHMTRAVGYARQTGPVGLAADLFMLAKAYRAAGDEAAAAVTGEEGRALYASLGRPEAEQVAAWLAEPASPH